MREGSMPLRLDWEACADNGGGMLDWEAVEENVGRGREKLMYEDEVEDFCRT